jgi:hypothetical protein
MSILCKIGIHKWKYTKAVYESALAERLGLPSIFGFRVCSHCGKEQEEDIHLLGVNPPEYVITYRNKPL